MQIKDKLLISNNEISELKSQISPLKNRVMFQKSEISLIQSSISDQSYNDDILNQCNKHKEWVKKLENDYKQVKQK